MGLVLFQGIRKQMTPLAAVHNILVMLHSVGKGSKDVVMIVMVFSHTVCEIICTYVCKYHIYSEQGV